MAEPAALRAKRYRQHKQGNHSLCVAGRCEGLGGTSRTVTTPVTPPAAFVDPTPSVTLSFELGRDVGRIEALAQEFVNSLPHGPDDPRYLLGQLAVELARRIDEAGAVPAAVGQLRILLMQLAEVPNGPAGVVDEMRVRHHQRQLDALLAIAS